MAVQKKKFFDVEVPLTGESAGLYSFDLESLNGRNIKLDLTRIFRGKGVEASFIVKVENGKAVASPRMLRLLPYFIRRIIRKRTSYIEDSFLVKTTDGILRIKPFLIARRKVSRSIRNGLRIATKEFLDEYAKDKPSEEIFGDVVSNKIQKPMLARLKKVYPLALCEIRHIETENKKEE